MLPSSLPKTNLAFIKLIISPLRWFIVAMSLLVLLGAASEAGLNYFIKLILDSIEVSQDALNNTELHKLLLYFFFGFLTLRGIVSVIWFSYHTLSLRVAPRIENVVKDYLLKHVTHHPFHYFQNNFSGQVAHKIMRAGTATNSFTMSLFTDFLYSSVIALTVLVIFTTIHLQLALTFTLWLTIYIPFSIYAVKKIHSAMKKVEKSRSTLTGRIVDILANVLTVKSFALFDTEHKNFNIYNAQEKENHVGYIRAYRNMSAYKTLLHTLLVAIIALAAYYLWNANAITTGDFALSLIMGNHVTTKLKELTNNIMKLTENSALLRESLDQLIDINDTGYTQSENVQSLGQNAIVLKDMSFSYDAENNVLDAINLTISENEKIGLIGMSGAGKSTFVNLLLGFFRANPNQIFIGDKDITTLNLTKLRQMISYIPQDTSLFHRSVRENIAYALPEASDEDIIKAAKKAYAHEFISSLPKGYNTIVGERGVKLSGGQRQRIAIARAILKDSPILILDEATSALDTESERYIQQSLETLMQNKTVIAIAHRLSTIAHLDRLLVLEQGKIIEQGTHETLIQQKGIYNKLWSMQSSGFLSE